MHSYTSSRAIEEISPGAWQKLAGERIFFAHRSVGAGIVAGLEEIAAAHEAVALRIVEGTDVRETAAPVFLHAASGENGNPEGKLARFDELLRGELGDSIDIAIFKFCYGDITADTDVARLFAEYQVRMDALHEARPGIVIVHVTTPLTTVQSGPKAFIKRILGKPLGGYADNVKRNEYNLLLRLAYAGREPVFDLALLESTLPDESRATFTLGGKRHFCLARTYTADAGHLNETGRKRAAEELLLLLTNICAGPPPNPGA